MRHHCKKFHYSQRHQSSNFLADRYSLSIYISYIRDVFRSNILYYIDRSVYDIIVKKKESQEEKETDDNSLLFNFFSDLLRYWKNICVYYRNCLCVRRNGNIDIGFKKLRTRNYVILILLFKII